jgi:16S rRNA (uracil1498-N3)-methyltransferase
MHARFHAPDATTSGETVSLPPEEAAHLIRVLRLKSGDRVRIFNGRGGEFDATIEHTDKRAVRIRLGAALDTAIEPRVAVTLAPAVLKGDKMDAVIRDAVMIGAAAVQPIVAVRSETTLSMVRRAARRERWERIAIASAKQCGRAVVPAILAPCGLDALLRDIAEVRLPNPALMFVEPAAAADATPLADLAGERPLQATVLVGPEGGWAPDEIAAGAAACRLLTLRSPTLRAEAMPLVAMAVLFARWGEW